MELTEARELVIRAGKKLLETGLIARTWGNVSCRTGKDRFVITPSGLSYENLRAADIVSVDIEDLSYEGSVEPSSEKGLHAVVYKLRPDVGFIVHTHQFHASVVSPLNMDITVNDPQMASLLGNRVVSIPYGLPGSSKLKNNVASKITRSSGKAFLMAAHGALCLGSGYDEVFRVADALEKVCEQFLINRYLVVSGKSEYDPWEPADFFAQGKSENKVQRSAERSTGPGIYKGYNSMRKGGMIRFYPVMEAGGEFSFAHNEQWVELSLERLQGSGESEGSEILEGLEGAKGLEVLDQAGISLPVPVADAALHRTIYRRYSSVEAVMHSRSPDILAVSRTGETIYPYLDDFAQIIGASVPCIGLSSGRTATDYTQIAAQAAGKLKGRSAILLQAEGALCCGPTTGDAQAALMIMEKNCRAVIASALFGRGKPINMLECRLMRRVYLTRYSKKMLREDCD